MKKLRITVGETTYEVTVEVLSDDGPAASESSRLPPTASVASALSRPSVAAAAPTSEVAAGGVTSPMSGVVLSVLVPAGGKVQKGQTVVVLDAMKMEVPVSSPAAGVVTSVSVSRGEAVKEGQVLFILT